MYCRKQKCITIHNNKCNMEREGEREREREDRERIERKRVKERGGDNEGVREGKMDRVR